MTICNVVRSSNLNSDVQPAIMLAFFSEALKQFWPDALPGITSDSHWPYHAWNLGRLYENTPRLGCEILKKVN